MTKLELRHELLIMFTLAQIIGAVILLTTKAIYWGGIFIGAGTGILLTAVYIKKRQTRWLEEEFEGKH